MELLSNMQSKEKGMEEVIRLDFGELPRGAQDILFKECAADPFGLSPKSFLNTIVATLQLNPHDPIKVAVEAYNIPVELAEAALKAINEKKD